MEPRQRNSGDVAVDQVWRHKRERHRRVTITHVYVEHSEPYVGVKRNTSRRRQAINVRTLRRDYELVLTNLPR